MRRALATLLLCVSCAATPRPATSILEDMTWREAAQALAPDTVVVIPLGAAAKERCLEDDHEPPEPVSELRLVDVPSVVSPVNRR